MKRAYRIAVIPGDGIGKEVVPEGIRVIAYARIAESFHLIDESRGKVSLSPSIYLFVESVAGRTYYDQLDPRCELGRRKPVRLLFG